MGEESSVEDDGRGEDGSAEDAACNLKDGAWGNLAEGQKLVTVGSTHGRAEEYTTTSRWGE